jgi:DNA-binding transcriptional ArsR family regulator
MSKYRDQALDRDQQILDRLAKIEHKVDSIEQTNAFALRAEADKHFAEVKKIFGRSVRRAQVYLAADGVRSVEQIAIHLDMKRQNVGPDLKLLGNEGLLELAESHGHQWDVWTKKPVDRTLRVTPFLCQEFGLRPDGLRKDSARKVSRRRK